MDRGAGMELEVATLRAHRAPSDLQVLGCVSAIYSHGVDPVQYKTSILQFIANLWLLHTKN